MPPGPEDPPPSSSTPAAPAGKGKKRGRQGFTCAECGVTKYRKPDFEGHLWSKHGLGTPIVCNLGECEHASYSSQSSLKQHIRTMHEKKLKFNCKKCKYGTDNQDCLTSHRINKHKEKFITQSGKKVEFKCKLCYKVFSAPHLLRKHERTVECTAEKTLPCPDWQNVQNSGRPAVPQGAAAPRPEITLPHLWENGGRKINAKPHEDSFWPKST